MSSLRQTTKKLSIILKKSGRGLPRKIIYKLIKTQNGHTVTHREIRLADLHPNSEGYVERASAAIKSAGLFDAEYYLEQNPDVKASGMDPLLHFVLHGGAEGRNPSADFSIAYYLTQNADVREMGINPLLHYVAWGMLQEDRGPLASPLDNEYEAYQAWQRDIKARLRTSLTDAEEAFNRAARSTVDELLKVSGQLVVYPLSYPLDVVQRPEHFFRYMASRGIPTLILENNDEKKPYIKKVRDNVYVTNTFTGSVRYLKDKETILYITYPLYSAVASELKPTRILYDVIDDLTTFSGSLKGLQLDHHRLLRLADVIMYSSNALFEKDKQTRVSGKKFIAENGVWSEDFRGVKGTAKYDFHEASEVVLGYYGAVSNILDWKLLDDLSAISDVRLVFIGPKADFANAETRESELMERVLAKSNVTHIPHAKYTALPKYASFFDAALVPFKVNDITNPVSPLKLFEYMAAGLKVFATNTTTLNEHKDHITVASAPELLKEASSWVAGYSGRQNYDYAEILKKSDWQVKFKRPIATLLKKSAEEQRFIEKSVDIINVNFYDYTGKVIYKGGAERYVFDLAQIIAAMGHRPRILQNASHDFKRTYRGIEIIGVKTGASDASGKSLRRMSRAFNEVCKSADLVVASPLDLACEITNVPAIGINHGIHWDNIRKKLASNRTSDYSEVFDALNTIKTGVCVDTNFINWTRTYDYEFGEKLKYVPNYYDGSEFKPSEKDFEGRLKIAYPRRLYDARGIYITLEAFDYLLGKYNTIDLQLVGQTDDAQVKKTVAKLMKKYKSQVTLEEFEMQDMYKAYKKSNVVLVPTRYSEGTSLSCLEAMATNNTIIATNIGGLPNLVIDHYNGLLIEPNTQALIDAVEAIVTDRSLAKKLAQNGLEVAKAFEKEQWDNRWRKILEEEL